MKKNYAKIAYEAWCKDQHWADCSGGALPSWEQLETRAAMAWKAAIVAVGFAARYQRLLGGGGQGHSGRSGEIMYSITGSCKRALLDACGKRDAALGHDISVRFDRKAQAWRFQLKNCRPLFLTIKSVENLLNRLIFCHTTEDAWQEIVKLDQAEIEDMIAKREEKRS